MGIKKLENTQSWGISRTMCLLKRFLLGFLVLILLTLEAYKISSLFPKVASDYYNQVKTGTVFEEKYTKLGKYKVNTVSFDSPNKMIKKIRIWYPEILKEETTPYPTVLMANGTGVNATRYEPIFEHLASWGFIVVGNECKNTGTGEEMAETLDFILKENNKPSSLFYQKIDLQHIGGAGHSQGASGLMNAVTKQENGDYYKAVFLMSLMQSFDSLKDSERLSKRFYEPEKLSIPSFFVAGTGFFDSRLISPINSMMTNFSMLPQDATSILARRKASDHQKILYAADGYMTAWFLWQLKGDEAASLGFINGAEDMKANPNWQDVRTKNI